MINNKSYIKRLPKKLQLGEYYIVWFGNSNRIKCKFIKPTEKGFNFLNLESNKCILKRHLYPSKCSNHLSGNWFWMNVFMNIKAANNEKG